MALAEVTVLIPNYNGAHLLSKNIPRVRDFLRREMPGAPLLVYDDSSTDGSALLLKTLPGIQPFFGKKNYGFGEAVNHATAYVKTEFILLLNTDVIPQRGLKQALALLRAHPQWLGVCAQQHLPHRQRGGGAQPEFRHGLFRHKDAFAHPPAARADYFPVLYPAGGAALLRVKHFRALKGFSPVFTPFYWEDADLGWRAWQAGHPSMCLAEFIVNHDHSPVILGNFALAKVRRIAARNLLLFNWRSIWGWGPWVCHLLWLPLHLVRSLISLDESFLFGLIVALWRGRGPRLPHPGSFGELYRKAGGQ